MVSIASWRAASLHKKAQKLSAAGDDEGALRFYEQAITLDPTRPTTLYNIGLIYKYRLNWKKSLEFNARAYQLDSSDEATRWNYAIAATALHDWVTARRLWAENGIEIAGGEGPIELDFGPAPLRLNPEANGEVVWGRRIDPARAKITSVPFPESGYRHGDIVLNDGAAVGYRMLNGSKRAVFNVLQLFETSQYSTYVVEIEASDAASLEVALAAAEKLGVETEDWTQNVRAICKQCSEGLPHDDHDRELETVWPSRHRVGVASSNSERLDALLAQWRRSARIQVIEATLALQGVAA